MAETMNMVERVARAMAASNGTIWGGPRGEDDPDFMPMRLAYLNLARAAIKAMRQPSPIQCEAALAALSDITVSDPKVATWDAIRAYRAMIDAALSEGGE